MLVTRHACQRAKERLGLNKKAIKRMAEIAYTNGIQQSDTRPKGDLDRFFTGLYSKNEYADNIRIYGEHVYIFGKDRLITVFKLPKFFQKMIKKV